MTERDPVVGWLAERAEVGLVAPEVLDGAALIAHVIGDRGECQRAS